MKPLQRASVECRRGIYNAASARYTHRVIFKDIAFPKISRLKPISHHLTNLVGLAVILAFAAGCSATATRTVPPTLSCGTLDWFELGRIDGAQGEPLDTFNRHIKLCDGSERAPDRSLYVGGREAGLIEFCTSASGLEAGKLGDVYTGVCPTHLERPFLSAFEVGKRIRALENENRDVENRISGFLDQLARARSGQSELERRLDELRKRRAQIETRISEIEESFLATP